MVDGEGASDFMSRGAMMSGLLRMEGAAALPFVQHFCGRPSSYLWEYEDEIVQGEGGEQGDPLVLVFFALQHHAALLAFQASLLPPEKLFASLDDIYAVVEADRVAAHP